MNSIPSPYAAAPAPDERSPPSARSPVAQVAPTRRSSPAGLGRDEIAAPRLSEPLAAAGAAPPLPAPRGRPAHLAGLRIDVGEGWGAPPLPAARGRPAHLVGLRVDVGEGWGAPPAWGEGAFDGPSPPTPVGARLPRRTARSLFGEMPSDERIDHTLASFEQRPREPAGSGRGHSSEATAWGVASLHLVDGPWTVLDSIDDTQDRLAEEAQRALNARAAARADQVHGPAVAALRAAAERAWALVPEQPAVEGGLTRETFVTSDAALAPLLPAMALALRLPEMVAAAAVGPAQSGIELFDSALATSRGGVRYPGDGGSAAAPYASTPSLDTVVALTAPARAAALAAGAGAGAVAGAGAGAALGNVAPPVSAAVTAAAREVGELLLAQLAVGTATDDPQLVAATRELVGVGMLPRDVAGGAAELSEVLGRALQEGPWADA